MVSEHVAKANRRLTGAQVAQLVISTAAKVGPYPYAGGRNDFFGAGRLDVYAAVQAARHASRESAAMAGGEREMASEAQA